MPTPVKQVDDATEHKLEQAIIELLADLPVGQAKRILIRLFQAADRYVWGRRHLLMDEISTTAPFSLAVEALRLDSSEETPS